jgi:hypothetical protein
MTHRITYNSTNIDGVVIGSEGPRITIDHQFSTNRAGSGKVETISQYGLWRVEFTGYFNLSTYHDLLAWFAWARQGQTFSFAMDSTEVGNTTLDDAAASGQAVVPVTATTSFSAGDVCLIDSATTDNFEVITIDSISAGVSVTADANLKYTYASGDTCRHLHYWPSLVIAEGVFTPIYYGVTDTASDHYYQHTFRFDEAP